MTTPVRSCAVCGGHWLGHDSVSLGGRYYCPTHLREQASRFNPRVNDLVRFIDGDQRSYVVLYREGDMVRIRPLDNPEALVFTVSVHTLWGAR